MDKTQKICPACGYGNVASQGICAQCGVTLLIDSKRIPDKTPQKIVPRVVVHDDNLVIEDFMLPSDQIASGLIKNTGPIVQALSYFLKKVNVPFLESIYLGNAMRLSTTQRPDVFRILERCASALSIDTPRIYIKYDPTYNAFTYGTDKEQFIVLNSALINDFTEAELCFIIGHECGHIKSGHVLFHTAYSLMLQGVLAITPLRLITAPALYAMIRESELTADRAGLLASMNPVATVRALLKFIFGNDPSIDQINIMELVHQIDDMSRPHSFLRRMNNDHPDTIKRIKEIIHFTNDSQYSATIRKAERIMNRSMSQSASIRSISKYATVYCPNCDSINLDVDETCKYCKSKLPTKG